MNLNFTINYGSESEHSVKGKLNAKMLEEVERCLDKAVEALEENHVGSIAFCCTLEAEKEEN